MKFEFSAGGVVTKKENEKIVVLLGQHSQHHGWVFPKGLIGDNVKGEQKEDTAIREVEEETGILAQLGKPLSPITYWYDMAGEKRKKTVYYFLMEFLSEDKNKKDDEMENVEWMPMDDVAEKLTYQSDKTVWKEAKQKIEKSLATSH